MESPSEKVVSLKNGVPIPRGGEGGEFDVKQSGNGSGVIRGTAVLCFAVESLAPPAGSAVVDGDSLTNAGHGVEIQCVYCTVALTHLSYPRQRHPQKRRQHELDHGRV